MKLQQLRYLWEVARHNLNVSATAEDLYTSQPGISKQIRLLEDELGLPIFARNGKHLTDITPAGLEIIEAAGRILAEVSNIRQIVQDHKNDSAGSLSIATTHTQARYILPVVVRNFMALYPHVTLDVHQGTPLQIAELAASRKVDFAIATEALDLFRDLVMLPCYRWNHCVIVPRDHPLLARQPLTLTAIAEYPIVTYVLGFTGRAKLDRVFRENNLQPRITLTAFDADVIKTYVKLGLGIGITARLAYDPEGDKELCALDVSHLFPPSITNIGLRRGMFLRGYMYDFLTLFAPHLQRELVEQALHTNSREEIENLVRDIDLPER